MQSRKTFRLLAALALVSFLLTAAPSSEAQTRSRTRRPGMLAVSGDRGLSSWYAVNGRSVSVSGRGNRVTLSGPCPRLKISGTGNRVYVDSVRSVSLAGTDNRVYWRRLYAGRRPRVYGAGYGNNQVVRRTGR